MSRLRPVGLFLLVGALIAFMPLIWQIVDDELAPAAASPRAPATSGTSDDWMVVSRDDTIIRVVGQTAIFQSCISYTSPGGTQERCQITGFDGKADSREHNEVEHCWGQSRIGDPLPDCWR